MGSTQECGMSKPLSSSSLPCWERRGGVRSCRRGLCLAHPSTSLTPRPRSSQGGVSAPLGEPEVRAGLTWPGVTQDREEGERPAPGGLGPPLQLLAGQQHPCPARTPALGGQRHQCGHGPGLEGLGVR